MKEIEQQIAALKAARGQEFAKGKANRDNELITRLHSGINNLKNKIKQC